MELVAINQKCWFRLISPTRHFRCVQFLILADISSTQFDTNCGSRDHFDTNQYILLLLLLLLIFKTFSEVGMSYLSILVLPELQNVNFFTQIKIWVQNFTPKTRNLRLICIRDKTRKSWSIQVVVGLVCYVRCPIGYLHRIWVECKCAWVKITPLKYRI